MISIHFKNNKFYIECPFSENTFVDGMMSKRFHKGSRVWHALPVRLNAEYIKNMGPKFKVIMSPEAESEVSNILKKFGARDEDFPDSYQFKLKPLPHQLIGMKKAYPVSTMAILADVGTGKTKVALDIAYARYATGKINKVLVIGLVSIKYNWQDEIIKNLGEKQNIHVLETSGPGKKRYEDWLGSKGLQWLIIGVESLSAGSAFELCSKFVDKNTMIILDESTSIKTHNSTRTEKCIELGKKVKYKTIMTGTPITQGLIDFYSQFEFLDPNIIGVGDFYSFRNRYTVMGGYDNKIIIGYKNVEELTNILEPYVFQVRKRDVLKDLPESSYINRIVEMTKEQVDLYKELKNNMRIQLEDKTLTVQNVMNMMQRFSEITGGYISYGVENTNPFTKEKKPIIYQKQRLKTAPKCIELMNFISECNNDESIIIWAVGKMEIEIIEEALKKKHGENCLVLMHGGIKGEERFENLNKFNRGESRFLLGNQKSGGIGLNMTISHIMVYYSNDFSLEKRLQSEGRIERIGQKHTMLYVDIMCKGSIDLKVRAALKDKNDFAEIIRSSFNDGGLLNLI